MPTELITKLCQQPSNIFINISVNGGNIDMSDRSISGNNFSNVSGSNFNLGDNVNQGSQNSIEGNEVDKLIAALRKDIEEKLSGFEKEEALGDAGRLEEAMKAGNKERAAKLFSVFSDVIRTTGSAASIATFLGI